MTQDTLYSDRFDDVYFSRAGGLDETRHVFMAGNGLPDAWAGRPCFTIAETGFGTGLNFLVAWQVFEETASPGQRLDFISFEKYPLEAETISGALAHWADLFGGRLARFLSLYPPCLRGGHRIDLSARVSLTLVFDDVNEALPTLVVPGGVDAWFLDGFTPAKNPDMWTETVFRGMARLSAPGATLATFTAAGFVRRGLAEAGFDVHKTKGFGHKRDMVVGRYAENPVAKNIKNDLNRIAIVGGGLAGTACAYVLGRYGKASTIFEASSDLAAGASGNRIGMLNPRFYARRSAESDFYTSAFALAGRVLRDMPDAVEFNPCGSLHFIADDEKRRRFEALTGPDGWPAEAARIVKASEASDLAGVPLDHEALWLPGGGTVNPAALCHAYAAGADIRLSTPVSSLVQTGQGWQVNGEDFDVVILACGAAVKAFDETSWLPVQTVRGQVTWIEEQPETGGLRCNLCYGGYITPARQGIHVIGSTFQKWLDHTDPLDEDDRDNLDKLTKYAPRLIEGANIVGQRAGLRTASQDRFPLIGAVPDAVDGDGTGGAVFPHLYLSTGHGSHGVISTLAGAVFLADDLAGRPSSLSRATIAALSPARFLIRRHRKTMVQV
ncbi:MAG: bifunctional tRNA (5-methylaminomethyl-2-thiouridine)(34)-methyltransferase MnmD/FAD-dependent 5-carboxymethylaminomethyl-2-thiouridine(34) oxidoreductase MnmC [Rhodospirillales bacterium]|nr:bifunctional tRNA (5-methylaminomethyl-2-thiouridine)(34)-methyltransferase MnmD/FAD-dependent 5-carboxymethylaminomethyl-2-thiouridine(34) oxidoreductase MnmC [Rhodospirillales bacterium]